MTSVVQLTSQDLQDYLTNLGVLFFAAMFDNHDSCVKLAPCLFFQAPRPGIRAKNVE